MFTPGWFVPPCPANKLHWMWFRKPGTVSRFALSDKFIFELKDIAAYPPETGSG